MKKIKLFSLVAAALFAGSTMAADVTLFTTNFSTADGWSTESIITSAQTTNTKVIKGTTISFKGYKTSDLTVAVGATESADGTLTFTGNNLSASAGAASSANYYMAIPVSNVNGTLTVTTTGDATKWYYSYDDGNKGQIVARLQASENRTFTITDLTNSDVTVYIGSNGKKMNSITFTTPEKIATTEPSLKFVEESVSLKVSPFVATAEAELTLKGGNLTAGTYDLTLPTVTGLTINPTSVTVAEDGALNETITLSYTSDVNVEAASAVLALTISELTASTTINYSANVDVLTQTTITEDVTWNWANAGSAEIVFTETSKPSKTDTIVLANVGGIANDANFNSQALLVRGQYMVRDSKYFQGDYISFNVEKAGTVQVVFSNTGNRTDEATETRYLYVNGTKTAAGSLRSDANVTSEEIAVAAGKVEITFMLPDEAQGNQYGRVYSVTYRVKEDIGAALDQAQVEAKAVKVIRDGQLLIIRDGKTYTAQGAELQ